LTAEDITLFGGGLLCLFHTLRGLLQWSIFHQLAHNYALEVHQRGPQSLGVLSVLVGFILKDCDLRPQNSDFGGQMVDQDHPPVGNFSLGSKS
jgi:hypothetical protein